MFALCALLAVSSCGVSESSFTAHCKAVYEVTVADNKKWAAFKVSRPGRMYPEGRFDPKIQSERRAIFENNFGFPTSSFIVERNWNCLSLDKTKSSVSDCPTGEINKGFLDIYWVSSDNCKKNETCLHVATMRNDFIIRNLASAVATECLDKYFSEEMFGFKEIY